MVVGIIGLGYVGLTLGLSFANKGVEVYGVETDENIKAKLKQNKAHFLEDGIDALIEKVNNKTFHVVDAFEKGVHFDAFIVTVGTPLIGHDTKTPNFNYILSALDTIEQVYDGTALVVLRSTVSVGTTTKFVLPRLAQMSGRPFKDVLLGFCPERTIEGKALVELTSLPQIISGNNKESINRAKELFLKLTPKVVVADSLEEAELAKLYCNVYRDMTFAIGNAFCLAAQSLGVDGVKVIIRANEGYPRSNIAQPGFVAGPCLEKDAHIMLNNMPESLSKNLIFSARTLNEGLEEMVCAYVRRILGAPDEKTIITMSGLAFKGRPETSDLRGSSAVYIAKTLHKLGYKLYLHDFVAKKEDMEALNVGTYVTTDKLSEACAQSKLLMVLNNHIKYCSLDFEDWVIQNGLRVLDVWNVCDRLHERDDMITDTIGTINLETVKG